MNLMLTIYVIRCMLNKVQIIEHEERRKKMQFDYSKLRGRITEICGCQMVFAEKMGMSERTLSLKLTSKRYWKQSAIYRAIDILGLSLDNITEYFFKVEVQNI